MTDIAWIQPLEPLPEIRPSLASATASRLTSWLLGCLVLMAADAAAVCRPTDAVNLDPIPARIPRDPVAKARLVAVTSGLVAPNWGTSAPGDTVHLFVSDTVGQLWAIDPERRTRNLVLDVSARIVPLRVYDERGLLGVAFHPDYQQNGLLYTYTSEPFTTGIVADFGLSGLPAATTPDHRSVVTEWKVDDPGAAEPRVDPVSQRVVLRIDQPQANHNGGALAFGPDGLLYVALGDGGGGDDQGIAHHPAIGNGQDRATPFGKILRIDPLGTNARSGQYGVPGSNPYAPYRNRGGGAGCADGFCDEIWAYGFRNPYRISFDRMTGALFAADVGQTKLEEIDVVRPGRNYGWRFKEGTFFFQPHGGQPGFISDINCRGVPTADLTDPIAQYDHDEGRSVIGGFVYRGRQLPALWGRYVFGDWTRSFAQPDGRLFYFDARRPHRVAATLRTIRELRLERRPSLGHFIFGFGQDAQGEVYVLGNKTGSPSLTAAGRTGVVFKLAPAAPQ